MRVGLHSLHRRRLSGDLIAVYKMFSGGLDLDTSLFFIPPVRPGLRGHPFKVLQGPSRRLRRKSSFSTRAVKYWNRIPTPIVTVPSVNSFKHHLDSAWKTCLLKSREFPSYSTSPPHTQLRNPLLQCPHLRCPNPYFTFIHNRPNVEIALYRITLPLCGYRGPLWSTLPLKITTTIIIIIIIIIIIYNGMTA